MRGSFEDGAFTNWYLQDGVVKAALTFGRSDDLDAARKLIVDGSVARRGAARGARRPRLVARFSLIEIDKKSVAALHAPGEARRQRLSSCEEITRSNSEPMLIATPKQIVCTSA